MDASLLLKLDIFTLMIMALCGYCLGFLTLTIIRVTHNDIPGVGVWWWSSLFAMLGQAGFASLLLTPTLYGSWVGNVFLIFHVSLCWSPNAVSSGNRQAGLSAGDSSCCLPPS